MGVLPPAGFVPAAPMGYGPWVFLFDPMCAKRVTAFVDGEYLKALIASGVIPVMGNFKQKEKSCSKCGYSWLHHMVLRDFPGKEVRVIAPVGRGYSMDLYRAAGGRKACRKMKPIHIERSLFPVEVLDVDGRIAAIRPGKYAPPP